MSEITIYHNPKCSKSRETLALIVSAGVKPRVIEYLDNALPEKELLALLKQIPASSLVRVKDQAFLDKPFSLGDPAVVARELHLRPALMERPVVMRNGKAVLGRPPENVKALL